MNKIKFSVIIPFFNENKYIKYCVQSVLNQTYKNFEVIIINDGSHKSSLKILHKITLLDKRIRLINLNKNMGVSNARNIGINNANGEFIAFLDSDDEWLNFKLECQLKIINKKKINFLHSSYYAVDENENFLGLYKAKNLRYNNLIKSCDIGLSTVIIKSNLAKSISFKNISTKEDYLFWLTVIKKQKILYGNETVLVKYRVKNKSLSSSNKLKFKNAFILYRKFLEYSSIKSYLYVLRLSLFWILKKYKSIFTNFDNLDLKIIKNINKIFKNNFVILSALNLASLAFLNYHYLNTKYFFFWVDGYIGKKISRFKKIPGREIIQKLKIPRSIKTIYLCGNNSTNQKIYLKNKFKRKIYLKKLPFFKKLSDVHKINLIFNSNSVIILNISSPKQELVALRILTLNQNKKIYIICIGGAVSMLSGEESISPSFLNELNLEWLWRLKNNTLFRLKRLLNTILIFSLRSISGYYKGIKIKKI